MIDNESFYDRHAVAYASATRALDISELRDRFLRYLAVGSAVLDAGCGAGRDLAAFAATGYQAVGFDASAAMVAADIPNAGTPVIVDQQKRTLAR